MIIGGSKKKVVENMRKFAAAGELNAKVETDDPVFTPEQSRQAVERFYKIRKNKVWFWIRSRRAHVVERSVGRKVNRNTMVVGLENLSGDWRKLGAVVTSNHFNPLDNLVVRKAIKDGFGRGVYIVSQETNLALPGFLGYLINHLDVVPLLNSPSYIKNEFEPRLVKMLREGELVLIYPEQEMWFNYRKPRPCKTGAYRFAAEAGVPVVPCFVEIREEEVADNDEFWQVRHVVHILEPIFPNPKLSVRANSIEMAQKDYAAKCAAYEAAYGKKLTYDFEEGDVAGWRLR